MGSDDVDHDLTCLSSPVMYNFPSLELVPERVLRRLTFTLSASTGAVAAAAAAAVDHEEPLESSTTATVRVSAAGVGLPLPLRNPPVAV